MDIEIKGKNIEVTEALESYVKKKLSRIDRFFNKISNIQVMLSASNSKTSGASQKVEVTVRIDGTIIRAQESSPDMYASIDLVVDKLERRIKKFKGKLTNKSRIRINELPEKNKEEEIQIEEEGALADRIIRQKRLSITPMSVEEALLQMELLGHDFFIFINAETSEVNVVYTRKEGGYGLIEITS
ncbi:MAG TPA: ribosome-associated translation inhibitor RaiA [bacterium]|jgi:putative sigma-54 modulation protein|nr:ribosome-associated translation inhibitor RaiA [Dictyoglomota bacterium]HHV80415.1 ribosome-associated translation inhibitor RaiA [bacterium]HOK29988.1 ribosome-associated translation inhibitor RaiA [bacterium]HOL55254.1 ribosome-associated translation inhibitor RaiA [bacterium]HPO82455.1 ribosome-associated translation inhibitor RaiA [bacterium]